MQTYAYKRTDLRTATLIDRALAMRQMGEATMAASYLATHGIAHDIAARILSSGASRRIGAISHEPGSAWPRL